MGGLWEKMARETKTNAPSAQKKSQAYAKRAATRAVNHFAGCGDYCYDCRDHRHAASLVRRCHCLIPIQERLLSWRGKRKNTAIAARSKHLNLFEHDPNLCVCSPLRATVTACAVNKDIKVLGDADGCRYLQGCAGLRNVSDGALDLRRFVADNDKGSLQYASARGYPLFVHRLSPQHQLA